jgi:hypothetical protein
MQSEGPGIPRAQGESVSANAERADSRLEVGQRDPRDPMDHLRQRAQKEAWYLRPEVLAHPAPELFWPGIRATRNRSGQVAHVGLAYRWNGLDTHRS